MTTTYTITAAQRDSLLASRLQHLDRGDSGAAKALDWALTMLPDCAPSAAEPTPDHVRQIACEARNSSGSASDDCGPSAYVLAGWRAALAAPTAAHAAEPRTLLQQYDREQQPGYRNGYEDGRLKGFEVGQRYARERAAPVTEPVAWAVYWGLPPTRKNSVHFERTTAEEVAARIKSNTEIRPLVHPLAPEEAKDAARYRWLKSKFREVGMSGGWEGRFELPYVPAWDDTPYSADRGKAFNYRGNLDAAVDAALSQGGAA